MGGYSFESFTAIFHLKIDELVFWKLIKRYKNEILKREIVHSISKAMVSVPTVQTSSLILCTALMA